MTQQVTQISYHFVILTLLGTKCCRWCLSARKCLQSYIEYNAIFGKVCRLASEDVVFYVINSKYFLVLNSLNFALDSTYRNLFNITCTDTLNICKQMFCIESLHSIILRRRRRFLVKYLDEDNCLLHLFVNTANHKCD